jgi:S1-C subfamily serine protease
VPDTAPRPEARIAVPPAAAPQKEVGPVVIPTLHMGKPADKNDRTEHERGSLAAKIFIEHKDSIVQIFGKGEMVEKNGKKAPFGDAGTGFFVTDDGRIVTAYHVVRDTNSLTVKTAQGKEYKAEIVKVDPDADLALIKLSDRQPDERFKAMSIGKTAPNAGDEVFTIGHPQGWSENFLSAGKYLYAASSYKIELNKLSFTKNVVESSKIHVEPGNSGGPLINKDGEAIGVISRLAYRGATKLESTGVADMQRFLGKAETASSSADVAFPSTLHLLNHNLNLYYRGRALVSERPGGVGSAFSIGLGVWDLATEDVTNFKNSVSNGSTRDIIGSSLHLGADALLIGGGIAGLTSRYRMAGTIAAAAGSAFKVGSDIVQGARATHKAFSG